MDIEKDAELFEHWWEDEGQYHRAGGNDYCKTFAWEAWIFAKNQAAPEGFVLVKKVHPDAIVHNQGLGLFKECQVIYGWDGKSKDFKDALNKGFYHGVKLGAKAVLETAMIEAAQEQAND